MSRSTHRPFDAVGAQSHLEVIGRYNHFLDQKLHDPCLLRWKQLIPNRVELDHGHGDSGLVQAPIEFECLRQHLTQEI